MPREYSLKLRKDFKNLYKIGIRKNSRNFQLIFTDSPSLKFGFIVAKKDIPTASHRNYTKRVLKEIIRKDIIKLFSTRNMHLAVSAKSDLKGFNYDDIREEVINLFKQINFNAPAIKKNKKRAFDDKRPVPAFTANSKY